MPDTGRIGGIIKLRIDGVTYAAKGDFTYNLGKPKLEAVVGADGIHGPKSTPQVASIEGKITDNYNLDVAQLVTLTRGTATLDLPNGKIFLLSDCWYAGDGSVSTAEGEIGLRLESASEGEEIR